MPSLQEAADQLGKDMIAQNMPGLMMALTPEGLMKAMALQGQLMAAEASAAAAGMRPPSPPTSATAELKGAEGEDEIVNLQFGSAEGVAEVQTRWRELAGVWKVNDFSLIGVKDAQGNPIDLPAVPGLTTPGSSSATS